MYVQLSFRVWLLQFQIIGKELPRNERERRCARFSQSAMARCANVHLPGARKFSRIHDSRILFAFFVRRRSGWRLFRLPRMIWLRSFELDVLASRTMTLLTRNSQHRFSFFIAILGGIRRKGGEVGGVALQASRNHWPIKIGSGIHIAGAIHPFPKWSPVRYRQLKEPVAFPIQIGLAPLSGAHYHVDPLSLLLLIGRLPKNCGFIVVAFYGSHREVQIRIESSQSIGACCEFSGHRILTGKLRSKMVRSVPITAFNVLMARLARIVAGVVFAIRLLFIQREVGPIV